MRRPSAFRTPRVRTERVPGRADKWLRRVSPNAGWWVANPCASTREAGNSAQEPAAREESLLRLIFAGHDCAVVARASTPCAARPATRARSRRVCAKIVPYEHVIDHRAAGGRVQRRRHCARRAVVLSASPDRARPLRALRRHPWTTPRARRLAGVPRTAASALRDVPPQRPAPIDPSGIRRPRSRRRCRDDGWRSGRAVGSRRAGALWRLARAPRRAVEQAAIEAGLNWPSI